MYYGYSVQRFIELQFPLKPKILTSTSESRELVKYLMTCG